MRELLDGIVKVIADEAAEVDNDEAAVILIDLLGFLQDARVELGEL